MAFELILAALVGRSVGTDQMQVVARKKPVEEGEDWKKI